MDKFFNCNCKHQPHCKRPNKENTTTDVDVLKDALHNEHKRWRKMSDDYFNRAGHEPSGSPLKTDYRAKALSILGCANDLEKLIEQFESL